MSRNFPDFLDAYFAYAKDGFCPDSFHFWTGISAVAGALERRVWVSQNDRNTFPNLYVFMIAHPGEGKTSSTDIGMRLLRDLQCGERKLSLLANSMSDAALVRDMAFRNKFNWAGTEYEQCAHFLYAGEAENTLRAITGGGELTASLTDFYDAQGSWQKSLISDDGSRTLTNVCLNILACCTHSFLNKLFPDSAVMGGFASRIIYVVHADKKVRSIEWETRGRNAEVRAKLLADLNHIYSLAGQFAVSPEYAQAYVEFFTPTDAHRRSLKNERTQAFLARKQLNIQKLSMICAVSDSDELRLELRHWDRARKIVEAEERNLPVILNSAATPNNQMGINRIIAAIFHENGNFVSPVELRKRMLTRGIQNERILQNINGLLQAHIIQLDIVDGKDGYRFIGNTDDYL